MFSLMPFTPLMDATDEDVFAAEASLYESDISRAQKSDLLTALGIFTGLRDMSLAQRLFERRRDIMIESPVYEMIKKEGIEEGFAKGLDEGKKYGLKMALVSALDARFGESARKLISCVDVIDDLAKIESAHRAVISGKTLAEVRDILLD